MHLTPGGAPDWCPDPRVLKVTVGGHCVRRESKSQVTRESRKSLLLLDVLCLCVVSIPFLICELGLVAPVHRGFFCDDMSIQFPETREETVSDTVLISVGILITGLAIVFGECHRVSRQRGSNTCPREGYFSAVYRQILPFLFGSALGQSLTNAAKLSAGRLRPNFLCICQPEALNCTTGFIETYRCTGDPGAVTEARKSFYSGHASFSLYSMLYLSFYLQVRMKWRGARLLRPLLQFVLVLLALYTGFSRISDHRHHPSDVAVGFMQGALVAYWVAFHISDLFKQKSSQSVSVPPRTDSPETFTNC
ncbi:phospholipid phosphatase 3-like [Spea bombifrons]|uniref:phospholipid phosphatase 3-like n=1 Tax=Spea bombifrons TaxID=233779 RepID=UPI00234AB2F4|nr:phospholipid phosphatase 3-like [Spea bombifrons]